jgi:chromatin remodeling complex protein RSC6
LPLCNVYKDNPTITIIMEAQQDLQTMLAELQEKLVLMQTTVKDTIALSKKVAKDVTKVSKAKPVKKAKAAVNGENKKSGFAKPTQLSPELYEFLGIPDTELLSRTDVTRHINKYVKDNNLQKPDERKVILPDEKLGKLLKIPDDVVLTYFNLQRYMKHLFVTATSPAK